MEVRFVYGFLDRASASLVQAEQSRRDGNWPLVVSRAIECVEYSIKAVLSALDAAYPRDHNVGAALLSPSVASQLPDWFRPHLARIQLISDVLLLLRSRANYGQEGLLVPAVELFTDIEAQAYASNAAEVHRLCQRFITERHPRQ